MSTGKLVTDAARQLNDWLESGNFKAGDRLPSERAIAKLLGLKYYALNRAMGRLIAEGRVTREGYRLTLAAGTRAHHRYVFHLIVSRRTQYLASYRRAAENLDIGLVVHTWSAAEEVVSILEQLDRKETDGVVCDPPFNVVSDFWIQAALRLIRHGIPVVTTGGWGASEGLSSVGGDVINGVVQGVGHLAGGGHRELALIAYPNTFVHGIGIADHWRKLCEHNHLGASGERILVQNSGLTEPEEIDAVVELLVTGAWKEVTGLVVPIGHSCAIQSFFLKLARRGRRVPESLSFVAVGNARTLHAAEPRVTAVSFDMVLWFELTYDLLRREVRERRQYGAARQVSVIQVMPSLTVRDSTRAIGAPPAVADGREAEARGRPSFAPTDSVELARLARLPYSIAAKASLAERPRFMPVDLRPYANRPLLFRRGWLGDIPLRCLDPGTHEIHGVPFEILGGQTRADCGAIVFQSTINTTGNAQKLPDHLVIPIDSLVEAVYVLHGCGYAKPLQRFARYSFHTADGEVGAVPMVSLGRPQSAMESASMDAESSGPNIQDWWSDFPHVDFPHARMAPLMENDVESHVNRHVFLYTLEWINPSPKKRITHLEIKVDPLVPTTLGVLAVTVVKPKKTA